MPITIQALEEYFSPNIGSLKENYIIPLAADSSSAFVQRFTLVTIFQVKMENKAKAIMFWILRKSQNAMVDYVSAYDALVQYIAKRDTISFYLLTLTKIENVISCCCQVFEVIMKLTNTKKFEKGDGSKYERLNRCYIRIKHLESSSLDETYVQATWLDEKGFNTNDACITYNEIKQIVEEVKAIAENLSTLK